MIVRIKDLNKLMNRHATWGNESLFCSQYTVLAIRKRRRKTQYLIENDKRLCWWDIDLFDAIDESIPVNWLTVQYKRFHKFKNRNYDFDISTSFYQGPEEFLQNENFFFDIIENPGDAYEFYCKVMKTNDRERLLRVSETSNCC